MPVDVDVLVPRIVADQQHPPAGRAFGHGGSDSARRQWKHCVNTVGSTTLERPLGRLWGPQPVDALG